MVKGNERSSVIWPDPVPRIWSSPAAGGAQRLQASSATKGSLLVNPSPPRSPVTRWTHRIAMDAWGSGGRGRVDNRSCTGLSGMRLLDQLLPQLGAGGARRSSAARPEVSSRGSMARSHRAELRLRMPSSSPAASSAASSSAAPPPRRRRRSPRARSAARARAAEIVLSFVATPAELARCGSSAGWYLASRMHSLWVTVRRSGRLGVAASPSRRSALPHEDGTLFETAARIERHGRRPLDLAPASRARTSSRRLRAYGCARPPPARLTPPPPDRRRLPPARPPTRFEFVERPSKREAPFGPRCGLRRARDVRRRDVGAPRGGEPAAGGEPADGRQLPLATSPHLTDLADHRRRAADRVPRPPLRRAGLPPPREPLSEQGLHLPPARRAVQCLRPAAPAARWSPASSSGSDEGQHDARPSRCWTGRGAPDPRLLSAPPAAAAGTRAGGGGGGGGGRRFAAAAVRRAIGPIHRQPTLPDVAMPARTRATRTRHRRRRPPQRQRPSLPAHGL